MQNIYKTLNNISMGRFKGKYRIATVRAQWHDYNVGAFFITICTKGREHFFGEIVQGKMILSRIGEFASESVSLIETIHTDVLVPVFVIMPDHIHMIVIIKGCGGVVKEVDSSKDRIMQNVANRCGRLSHIISRFKYAITRFARQNEIPFDWQTRFYDRIIRNKTEMNATIRYVENNVSNWK